MKRSNQLINFGLMLSIGAILLLLPSCRRPEREQLKRIEGDLAKIDRGITDLEKRFGRTVASASNCDFFLIDLRLSGGDKPKILPGRPKVDLCKHLLNEVVWVSVQSGYLVTIKVEDPPNGTKPPFPSLDCLNSGKRVCSSGPIDPDAQEDPISTYPNDPPDGHYFKYTVCLTPTTGSPVCADPGIIIHP